MQELLALRGHLASLPGFGGVRVAHLYSFLCLRLVSCVPNVATFSGFLILDDLFGFL
jgi:hypothetical protein